MGEGRGKGETVIPQKIREKKKRGGGVKAL